MKQAIDDVESRLNGKGRTVIRYSGTEQVLRLMIEGENQGLIQKELDQLVDLAQKELS